jgi:hypothetical protein
VRGREAKRGTKDEGTAGTTGMKKRYRLRLSRELLMSLSSLDVEVDLSQGRSGTQ